MCVKVRVGQWREVLNARARGDGGVKVELNFSADEAEGVSAELQTGDLSPG